MPKPKLTMTLEEVCKLFRSYGSLVDPLLLSQEEYPEMLLEEWEGYLLVFVGKKVFLADSRTAFSYENHMEYEWFVWDLPCAVTCTCVQDGILYLGTNGDGVFTLTVENAPVESYWVTPKDKFKYPKRTMLRSW